MTRQNEKLWQELKLNRQHICSIFAFTEYEWAEAGNTVILHLQVGDNLTVAAVEENYLYGSSDHIFTTFSGALILSDSDMTNPGKRTHRNTHFIQLPEFEI